MIIEIVTITNAAHVIAVPYGMRVDEAWVRIQAAWEEGVDPWPKGTLIKCYCQILTRPSGRLLAVQVA
jgi:hypothetical protein